MAGFIDRIRESAEKAAFEADRLRRVTGAQSDLRALIRRLEADTAELGKRVLALHDAGTLAQPDLLDACLAIDDLRQEITDKELQIQQIKEEEPPAWPRPGARGHSCPNCQIELPEGAVFCHLCGSRAVAVAPPPSDDSPVCSNCGTALESGAAHCPECGQSIELRPTEEAEPLTVVAEPAASAPGWTPVPSGTLSCPNCSEAISEEAAFCPECGQRITRGPVDAEPILPEEPTILDEAAATSAPGTPCPHCGAEIPEEAIFCPECGQQTAPRPAEVAPDTPTVVTEPLPPEEPEPPAELDLTPAEMPVVARTCPHCDAEIPEEAVFCPECGQYAGPEGEDLAPDMPTVLTEPEEPEPVEDELLAPEGVTVVAEPAALEPAEEEPLAPEEPEPPAELDLTPAEMPAVARTCPHCDAEIPEEAVFCPECGQYAGPEGEDLAPDMPTILTEPEEPEPLGDEPLEPEEATVVAEPAAPEPAEEEPLAPEEPEPPAELDLTPAEMPVVARTCPHCDAEIPEEAVFCPECGQYAGPEGEDLAPDMPTILTEPEEPEPLGDEPLEPEEATVVAEPAAPEPAEGEPLAPEEPEPPAELDLTPAEMPVVARTCPHCDAEIPEEAVFCPECGQYAGPEGEDLAPDMPTVLTEPEELEPLEDEPLEPEEATVVAEPATLEPAEEEPLAPEEPEPLEGELLAPEGVTVAAEPAAPEPAEEEPLAPVEPEPPAELDLTPAEMPVVARTCPHCDADIPEEAVFCPECGQYAAPAGEEIAPDMPTILTEPEELEPLEMPVLARACPHCGAEIPEEAVFCPECGQYTAPKDNIEDLAPDTPTVLAEPAGPAAPEPSEFRSPSESGPVEVEMLAAGAHPPALLADLDEDVPLAGETMRLRRCPSCQAGILDTVTECPACGHKFEAAQPTRGDAGPTGASASEEAEGVRPTAETAEYLEPEAATVLQAVDTDGQEPETQEAQVAARCPHCLELIDDPGASICPHCQHALEELDADPSGKQSRPLPRAAADKGSEPAIRIKSEPRKALSTCPQCLGLVRVDAQFCPTCRHPLGGLNPAPPSAEGER